MILALQYSPAPLPARMNLSGWRRTLVQQTLLSHTWQHLIGMRHSIIKSFAVPALHGHLHPVQ